MVLDGTVDMIVANAYKIKHTTKKKTDLKDSEWLAELCLNDMIEPSRIFPKEDRELRNLTRAREACVRDLSKGMCLAPLNQHHQTDFVMSSAASSEKLIARNIGNRY